MAHPTPNPTEDLKAPVTLREERKHEWVKLPRIFGETLGEAEESLLAAIEASAQSDLGAAGIG